MRTIAVVGGSLAGLSTARGLRSLGFDGRLVIVGDERQRPYDRPPLSKAYLAGELTEPDLALEAEDEDLNAEWRLGVEATALQAGGRQLELSDASTLTVDGVVVATGASPRRLRGPSVLGGVHVLRTLDDARALRAELAPGARLVVVGAGFIGAEVASTARALGVDVTVVEATPVPMAGVLGAYMGEVLAGLHADHGVRLLCGVGVAELVGDSRVRSVRLTDDRVLPADVVLVAVGVRANTDWLLGSGLGLADGVVCNSYGGTELPGVVAVGDCASWFDPALGRQRRFEHWTPARERGLIAAAWLLSGGGDRRTGRPPYFWSDQYGVRIQFTGDAAGFDHVTVDAGSVVERDFLAVYHRAGQPVAALAVGQRTAFAQWRRQLAGRRPVPAQPKSLQLTAARQE